MIKPLEPGTILLMVGAPGLLPDVVTGITSTVPEAAPVPALFVAVTLQLYFQPLVRPVTVIGLTVVPVFVTGAKLPVTQDAVYLLMVAPPLEAGAVKATLAWPEPAVAAPIVGAPGTVTAATGVTSTPLENRLSPTLLVAFTVQVYLVPLVRPVTVTEVAEAAAVPVNVLVPVVHEPV